MIRMFNMQLWILIVLPDQAGYAASKSRSETLCRWNWPAYEHILPSEKEYAGFILSTDNDVHDDQKELWSSS